MSIRLTVLEPFNVVYVHNKKAGSTTLKRMMLDQFPTFLERKQPAGSCFNMSFANSQIPACREKYGACFWFTFVRNPYDRFLSAYHDKLNRYVRRFEPWIYARAKLYQTLRGPQAWKSHRVGIEGMIREFSPGDLLQGLQRHGIDFDEHFRPQCRVVATELIDYDFVGQIENFTEDLRSVLHRLGDRDEARHVSLAGMQRNVTGAAARHEGFFTPEVKRQICELYREDFDAFGYAR